MMPGRVGGRAGECLGGTGGEGKSVIVFKDKGCDGMRMPAGIKARY